MIKTLLVEVIGTFWLSLSFFVFSAYAGSPGYVALYVPAAVAAAYAVLVALFGSISGGHFNPAVTLGWLSLRRMRLPVAATYVLAQVVGAFLAVLLFRYLSGNTPLVDHGMDLRAFLAEALATMFLVWIVVATNVGSVFSSVPGLGVGIALFVALSIAQAFSGGILNPAIALAGGSYGFAYLVAPLLGGVIGALLARYFHTATTLVA